MREARANYLLVTICFGRSGPIQVEILNDSVFSYDRIFFKITNTLHKKLTRAVISVAAELQLQLRVGCRRTNGFHRVVWKQMRILRSFDTYAQNILMTKRFACVLCQY
jgi:hypothetical protein